MREQWLLGVACVVLSACGSTSDPQNAATAGAAGMVGVAGMAGAAGMAGTAGTAGTTSGGGTGLASAGAGGASSAGSEQCPALPVLSADATSSLTLPIQIVGAGAPITTGQAITPATGSSYKLSLLKFYLSSPVLLKSDGTRAPAALVQADGMPRAYGVALVDLDDPASQSLTVSGPPGDYAGLELGVGLPAACNAGDPTKRAFPLNADSDMFWTWGTQYMFIRVEGSRNNGSDWSTFALHVGYQQAYRSVHVMGELHLRPGAATASGLRFDVDHLLNAPAGADPSGANSHEAPDEWVADNAANGALALVP